MLYSSEFKEFISQNAVDNDPLIVSGNTKEIRLDIPVNNQKVSKQLYTQFYNIVWKAFLTGEKYWILEKQYNNTVKHSGIMLDIDAYQTSAQRIITKHFATECVSLIVKILYDYIDIPKETSTYCLFLLNSKPYFKDDLYKEGIHILLPSIKLTKEVKNLVYKVISEPLSKLFKSFNFVDKNVLDPDSFCVPSQVYGTIRKNKTESHMLRYAFNIVFNDNIVVRPIKKDTNIFSNKYNYALEFSLHYDGEIIKKYDYNLKKEKSGELPKCGSFYKDIESEKATVKTQCKNLALTSYLANEVFEYIKLVNLDRGKGGQLSEWKLFMMLILAINKRYIPYCKYFSIKADEVSWKKGGIDLLEKFVLEVEYENKERNYVGDEQSQKALETLKRIAKIDSPLEYKSLRKKTFEGQLGRAFNSDMVINQLVLAKIVSNILEQKLAYITITSQNNNNGYWMEYIDEEKALTSPEYKPFIYKYYRHDKYPKTLDDFLQIDLHNALQKFTTEVKKQGEKREKPIDSEEEYEYTSEKSRKEKKKQKNMYEEFVKKLVTTTKMVGTCTQLENIKTLCKQGSLINNALYYQLNVNDNVLGVDNGILVFNTPVAKFIEGRSSYKISRTTDTVYMEYNAQNEHIKTIESILEDIMPDEKKREALLMHLSLCFVGNSAERYFNVFYSGGASGKSLIMYLMENVFGSISSCNFGSNSGFGYCENINADIFISGSNNNDNPNGPNPQLINLEHARFVHAPEGRNGLIKSEVFKKLRDGATIRGLYEKARTVTFKGVIVYVTNNKPRFLNYNYALERRFLFIYFGTRFTFDPRPNTNEKKANPDHIRNARHNKDWATAFMAILINSWNNLQKNYGGNIEKVYEQCGFLKETKEYLSTQNFMLQFKSQKVEITGKTEDKIEVTDFCRIYSLWYKNKLNISKELSPENFVAEAMENFPDNLHIENYVSYFVGIQVIS